MENHIFKFNIELDKNLLLNVLKFVKKNAVTYKDNRQDSYIDNWKIVRHNFPYATDLIFRLGLEKYDVRPRFYILHKNTTLKMHKDLGTQCSANFILSDDPSPVSIEGTNYYYENALLNTQLEHGITYYSFNDRLLFKLSIMDLSFIDAKNIISANLPNLDHHRNL